MNTLNGKLPLSSHKNFPSSSAGLHQLQSRKELIKGIFKLLTLFCCVWGRLFLHIMVNMANFFFFFNLQCSCGTDYLSLFFFFIFLLLFFSLYFIFFNFILFLNFT